MRKFLALVVTTIALVPLAITTGSTAATHPRGAPAVLKIREAATVYPGLAGGDRFTSRYGLTAPRFVKRHGRLKCDRYRNVKGISRRGAYFFNVKVRRSVTLSQDVVRFRSVKRAKSMMRYYRNYLRKCRGNHPTTDGEGGKARMKVRGWSTPRIGGGSIGLLNAFIQYGEHTWRRTIVARTGRTVSVQEATPFTGKGAPKRVIKISRKAIGKLS